MNGRKPRKRIESRPWSRITKRSDESTNDGSGRSNIFSSAGIIRPTGTLIARTPFYVASPRILAVLVHARVFRVDLFRNLGIRSLAFWSPR